MKEIIWKLNNHGGKTAFVGGVKIGNYFYNGIDSKNGRYKVSSFMPQSGIEGIKVDETSEAERIIVNAFNAFVAKISK